MNEDTPMNPCSRKGEIRARARNGLDADTTQGAIDLVYALPRRRDEVQGRRGYVWRKGLWKESGHANT